MSFYFYYQLLNLDKGERNMGGVGEHFLIYQDQYVILFTKKALGITVSVTHACDAIRQNLKQILKRSSQVLLPIAVKPHCPCH